MCKSKIIIAIDGHSSSGKSTLAKDLAKHLNYRYIDSGAMYRAVALYLLEQNIDIEDRANIIFALKNINLEFKNQDGINMIFLNNRDVSKEIRHPRVTDIVSEVSVISEVRTKLVELQRSYGNEKAIVMDGRDIGTVVFPNAELKLFVTANQETRGKRRLKELQDRAISIDLEQVIENLKHRDHIDSTREDSPLRQAEDAIFVDNSNMNREEQLGYVLSLLK